MLSDPSPYYPRQDESRVYENIEVTIRDEEFQPVSRTAEYENAIVKRIVTESEYDVDPEQVMEYRATRDPSLNAYTVTGTVDVTVEASEDETGDETDTKVREGRGLAISEDDVDDDAEQLSEYTGNRPNVYTGPSDDDSDDREPIAAGDFVKVVSDSHEKDGERGQVRHVSGDTAMVQFKYDSRGVAVSALTRVSDDD